MASKTTRTKIASQSCSKTKTSIKVSSKTPIKVSIKTPIKTPIKVSSKTKTDASNNESKLWEHQINTAKLMGEKEYNLVYTPKLKISDKYCKINIGLVCNDVGTGKTISVLEHIRQVPLLKCIFSRELDKWCAMIPSCLVSIIMDYMDYNKFSSIFDDYLYDKSKLFYKYEEHGSRSKHPNNNVNNGNNVNNNLINAINNLVNNANNGNNNLNNNNLNNNNLNNNNLNNANNDNPNNIPIHIDKKKNVRDEYGIRLLSSTLIVVPHVIFSKVWLKELDEKFSNELTYYPIKEKRNKLDAEEFDRHNIVLCKATKYKDLALYCNFNKLRWQRVIIDEVATISIRNCPGIDSLFYWGITATYTDLKNIQNFGFLRTLFATLSYDDILKVMVKVDNSNLDKKCFNFSPYIKYNIICKCPPQYKILIKCYPKTVLCNLLNEELYVHAKEYVLRLVTDNVNSSPYESSTIDNFTFASLAAGKTNYHDDASEHKETKAEVKDKEDKLLYKRGRAKKKKEPSREISILSLLELQLLNLNLNRTLSPIVKEERTLFFLKAIYEATLCFRCCKSIEPPAVSFRTSCCELNYCFECICNVLACPICAIFTQKPLLQNNFILNDKKEHFMGIDSIQKKNDHIDNLKRLRYIAEGGSLRYDSDITDSDDDLDYSDDDLYDEKDLDEKDTKASSSDSDGKTKKRKLQKISYRNIDLFPELDAKVVLNKTKKIKIGEELDKVEIKTIISQCIEKKYESIIPGELDKTAAYIKIIQENPELRLAILVNDPKMGEIICKRLEEEKTFGVCLKGASGRITNLVKKFNDGDVDILILNSNHTGAGLNLQMGDGLIVYNAKNEQAIIQAIGRFQRHGRSRSNVLKVWVLKFK